MKRLDDIRGAEQSIRPKLRRPVRSQRILKQIRRPVRKIRTHKPFNFFKVPKLLISFIWQYKMKILVLIVLVLIVGGGVFLVTGRKKEKNTAQESSRKRELEQVIIKEDTELIIDFSFNLKMIINNQPQAIPANYGKIEDEKAIFNTDIANGDIHVQSPNKEAYTLSDFFVLWGSQFSSNCLLNHCLGGSGTLSMTVNGKINPEMSDYVIKPGDQIVITYNDLP